MTQSIYNEVSYKWGEMGPPDLPCSERGSCTTLCEIATYNNCSLNRPIAPCYGEAIFVD